MSESDRGRPVCPHCGTTALYTVTPRGQDGKPPYHVCPGGHEWRAAETVVVSGRARARLLAALDRTDARPNAALLRAAARHRDRS